MGNHTSRIALLNAEPDLGRFMSEDERRAASRLSVPIETLPRGPVDLTALFRAEQAFGAVVLEGMLFTRPRLGDQVSLRVLGPGDVLSLPGIWRSSLRSEGTCSAAELTTVALLGNEILLAARRWPRIVAGFHVRMGEQSERITTQLVICQLPRVDQRLLAMMWLLAESWGHVTSSGTRLPVSLTHDGWGALIGARRPTVTLALGELTERGAIVRQERGWLLLEQPVQPTEPAPELEPPALLEDAAAASWSSPSSLSSYARGDQYRRVRAEVSRLREEHLRHRDSVRARLRELAATRERTAASRRRIAEEALSRRSVPS